uniref:Uncharacterized protein n=1 Tax=Siphoviridae sp. ctDEW4 TaxID=2823569 RepID=A0A8S5L835_9CAUD|nr:MAG TPA: hypothetical protein [Siphoviridae sp. ctDEW4]
MLLCNKFFYLENNKFNCRIEFNNSCSGVIKL